MNKIKDYPIIPRGRAKDYSNQIIGDFKVLYRTNPPKDKEKSDHAYWLCQCQKCSKYKIIAATRLKRGVCECECKYDLTGKQIGRWTVLYKTNETTKNGTSLWHCKCSCGNEKDVDGYTLRSGQSKSCGCLQREQIAALGRQSRIDLTGRRFGKLVALYPIYNNNRDEHTKWHCKCDCGNEIDVDMGNLRSGKTQSCGCSSSKQEENIIKLLTKYNISFIYQWRPTDFATKKFDFYINNTYIIEFDGSQHFTYTGTGWNTKEHFLRTHKSDLEKNKYCFQHKIPIIRIPYNIEYTIDDLKLETTRFLLTPENEEKYYDRS